MNTAVPGATRGQGLVPIPESSEEPRSILHCPHPGVGVADLEIMVGSNILTDIPGVVKWVVAVAETTMEATQGG